MAMVTMVTTASNGGGKGNEDGTEMMEMADG